MGRNLFSGVSASGDAVELERSAADRWQRKRTVGSRRVLVHLPNGIFPTAGHMPIGQVCIEHVSTVASNAQELANQTTTSAASTGLMGF